MEATLLTAAYLVLSVGTVEAAVAEVRLRPEAVD